MPEFATPIDWAAVKTALGDIPHADDSASLRLKSRDFFWFSPILKEDLEGRLADLVVAPRDEADVIAVAALFQHYSADLPSTAQLANYDPAVVTRLYSADGKLMAEYAKEKRFFLPLSAIPVTVRVRRWRWWWWVCVCVCGGGGGGGWV